MLHNYHSQRRGLSLFIMAKINSGSSGCRVVVMAGKYLSSKSPQSSNQRQRKMFGPNRCMMSSDVAGAGGKNAPLTQQDCLGYYPAAERHALANRNLIYRDVKAFLNEVGGDSREARYWLTQFQRATSSKCPAFAVLEVGWCSGSSSVWKKKICFVLLWQVVLTVNSESG